VLTTSRSSAPVLIQHLSLLTNIIITLPPPAADWVMPLNMTHKLWRFFKKPTSSKDDMGMLSIFLISHMKLPTLYIRKAHKEVSAAFFKTCWFNKNCSAIGKILTIWPGVSPTLPLHASLDSPLKSQDWFHLTWCLLTPEGTQEVVEPAVIDQQHTQDEHSPPLAPEDKINPHSLLKLLKLTPLSV